MHQVRSQSPTLWTRMAHRVPKLSIHMLLIPGIISSILYILFSLSLSPHPPNVDIMDPVVARSLLQSIKEEGDSVVVMTKRAIKYQPEYTEEYISHCPGFTNLRNKIEPAYWQKSIYMTTCNTFWIQNASLSITEKIQLYNQVVDAQVKYALAKELANPYPTTFDLLNKLNTSWKDGGILRVEKAFEILEKSKYISAVYILPTNEMMVERNGAMLRSTDSLVSEYFTCTASGPPLEWAKSINGNPPSCLADVQSLRRSSYVMDPRMYNYHYWYHDFVDRYPGYGLNTTFSTDWDLNCGRCTQKPKAVTFVHIIRNAAIVDPGVAFQIDDQLRLAPLQCKHKGRMLPMIRRFEKLLSENATCKGQVTRDVVFSIAENFQGTDEGFMFYHCFGESTVKLVIYHDFLRKNPHVAIHVRGKYTIPFVQDFVTTYLKLNNEVVSGTAFAKVAIMPEGNPCFHPGYLYLQTAREFLIERLNMASPPVTPNSIVYVQRTVSRVLVDEYRIMKHLEKLADMYQLDFQVYSDADHLSVAMAGVMFHNALMTVGAHGAGLTNIIFAQQRTVIFEIVCEVSPVTFMNMAHKLGMRHHAFYGYRVGDQRCDEGISITRNFSDFEQKTSDIFKLVVDDFYIG